MEYTQPASDSSNFITVNEKLENQYGRPDPSEPPLGNQLDPLDELIFIMLTTMTEYGSQEVFIKLKKRYPSWQNLLISDKEEFFNILRPLGLVKQRGNRILSILETIKLKFGKITLAPLIDMCNNDVESFLTSLPGVGKKIARCIMMYSLNRNVFPVDTHVLRLCGRLGLIDQSISWQKAHDLLQSLAPKDLRYSLHVNLVIHGKEICKAKKPKCDICILNTVCPSASLYF